MGESKISGLCPHGNFRESCQQCKAEAAAKAGLDALIAQLSKEEIAPDQRKELVRQAWEAMRGEFIKAGGVYSDKPAEMLRSMRGEYLVRREDPARVIEAVKDRKAIDIAYDPRVGARYANAVEWTADGDQSGMRNAWGEGRGLAGGIATVIGFEKGGLRVEKVPGLQQIGGTSRGQVRNIEGSIRPEDVRFVLVGMPASLFPGELSEAEEDLLAKRERDPKLQNEAGSMRITRGFAFKSQPPGEDRE